MAANLRGLDKTAPLLVSLVFKSPEDDSEETAKTKFAKQMMIQMIEEEDILASDKLAKFGVLPINRCVKTYGQYPIEQGQSKGTQSKN